MIIVLGLLALVAGICGGGALLGLVVVVMAARNDRSAEFPRARVITARRRA